MNKELNSLISSINNIEEIKRLKELEKIIDSNPDILSKFEKLKGIAKQLVNARYYNNKEKVASLDKEYKEMYESISNIVFVEEYLELLDDAYNLLKVISETIESEINNELL